MNIAAMLQQIQQAAKVDSALLAQMLETSRASVERWLRGMAMPSPAQTALIQEIYTSTLLAQQRGFRSASSNRNRFSSRGARRNLPLLDALLPELVLSPVPLAPILERVMKGHVFQSTHNVDLEAILARHAHPAKYADAPSQGSMSAGKNTYTYDAHTYHTKVPPQGIAELIAYYLPEGGLVLDPFAGSGMTGVATNVLGYDCILNELSPAACFIANQFNAVIDVDLFKAGVNSVLEETKDIREYLYTTTCRECNKRTEILYTIWSYNVVCPHCSEEFQLWDYCRSYGRTVREHRILSGFPCPKCKVFLRKSSLSRTKAFPVSLGYKCCGSKQQEVTHSLSAEDLALIQEVEVTPPLAEYFVPRKNLYNGVNLRQPMKHGFDRVDKFYTNRNLAALSHLWEAIHRIEQVEIASFLAFTFTSLYQRVTKFSEFRFWGGSGNTARFNVPYIYNETNVFLTFIRKAKSIQDHLQTTARTYSGAAIVVNGSANNLDYLPNDSIDLVFTDPPFGANINYSEMNILWESWLGTFTDTSSEAIINKFQGKGIKEYQELMSQSLVECRRVLRPGGWLLLMFMNSSKDIWIALRSSIEASGLSIVKIDMFDKQHGTFKQFVSDNAAGFDLVIHCRKPDDFNNRDFSNRSMDHKRSVAEFVHSKKDKLPINSYLHVERGSELDYRQLYSEWLSQSLFNDSDVIDFAEFRRLVNHYLSDFGIA